MSVGAHTLIFVLLGAVLLFAAGRHAIRRWNRRLIEEANRQLRLPVPAFQTENRADVIDRLLADEELDRRIDEQAAATGQSADALRRRCRRYADEIVPAFNAVFYFRIGRWLARTLLLSLYKVDVRVIDQAAIDAIEPGSSVVLIMNHRSNMDVFLIAYLAARRSTLINTAGEWARAWPLYHFVHLAGDCVTDRDTQDVLYKQVFKSFVQMAVRGRCNMAIFPEGELPRDGSLHVPKFGLLSYIVSADPALAENLYLIPVGINYDRIPEERQLLADPDAVYRRQGSLRKLGSIVRAAFAFAGRFVLPGRANFGTACASFGRPVALSDWQIGQGVDVADKQCRREWVSDLGNDLFGRAARLMPVLPSHVLGVLLVKRSVWPLEAISEEGVRVMNEIRERGGVVCSADSDERRALAEAAERFARRKLVSIDDGGELTANPEQMPVLRYLANSVQHLLVSP